ncbi:MAG: OmpA family protein [Saprospiraceae bacterium]
MRKLTSYLIFCLGFVASTCYAQNVTIEGYVFETNNRGYLNIVEIQAFDQATMAVRGKTSSDLEGKFKLELPANSNYLLRAKKKIFKSSEKLISTEGKSTGEKMYVKIEMEREPGYLFDVTMAEKRVGDNPADAIIDATIEVYNNTKKEEALVLKNHPYPTFNFTFEQGNHYTIMIRKDKFFNKRMEAYVNVEGCILCFDGVGNVKPGVSDVLTEGHQMGTLLANVELTPIEMNKSIKLEHIYYDYNDYKIRKDAALELDKLIGVLRDNPSLIVEIGSHTDARGKDPYNLKLSKRRAKAAVDYVIDQGGIDAGRIEARGYGETVLVNKCKNGTKCSEAKHQENRRTELKIIGVAADDPYARLSLAEIIEAEEFQRLLEEVQNQEIVKVAAGEELPDEIKNQQNQQILPKAEEKEVVTKVKPVVATKEVLVKSETPKPEKNPAPSKTTMKQLEAVVPQTSTGPTYNESSVQANPVQEIPPSLANPPKQNESMEPAQDMGTIDNPKVIRQEATANSGMMGSGSIVTREVEVTTNINFRAPKSLPVNYQGYRIEFYNTNAELPLSHVIFTRHGDITLEQKKNGTYAYLIGDFKSEAQASEFLKAILKDRYPNAKVIKYKKGYRVDK